MLAIVWGLTLGQQPTCEILFLKGDEDSDHMVVRVPLPAEEVAMIDRTMIGMTRPTSANAVQLGGGPKQPPQNRFAGPIKWSCAFCGALLIQGVNDVYAEHAIPCYRCGEWNRTPYPDEQR